MRPHINLSEEVQLLYLINKLMDCHQDFTGDWYGVKRKKNKNQSFHNYEHKTMFVIAVASIFISGKEKVEFNVH